ncbi:MAG TPA: alpha/beta hydrolase [Chitinophaga sp.]|uniref:alpha/beta fold hydrolase n=1 Tax=Chitinophaga sp. TaxID=1869181 RepID=UPI002B87D72D|nr:alpha/beta hydrolase [Chitinophaga sp.]HVI48678.1 alpha/beta hydrolase [Chitinophaga sp.]
MMHLKKWILALLVFIALFVICFLFYRNTQETATLDNNARSHAPGRFIQLREGLVHYSLSGPDTARLLVLIHGGGSTGMEVWKYNRSWLLSKGYRVLTYDLYGRGYSDRPDITYDLALYRRQLTALLDTLHIRGSFDIIAMSMGAAIGMDYAGLHPEQVDHVVLLDPAASGDLQPNKLLYVPGLSDLMMSGYWYPRSIEKQRKEFVNQPLFNDYAKRLAYFMNFKGYKRLTLSTWMNMLSKNQLYLLKNIPPNRIMLLYGRQDPFFPPEKLDGYRLLYPSLLAHEINNAGHMPHYEQPDVVNPLMYDYLTNNMK